MYFTFLKELKDISNQSDFIGAIFWISENIDMCRSFPVQLNYYSYLLDSSEALLTVHEGHVYTKSTCSYMHIAVNRSVLKYVALTNVCRRLIEKQNLTVELLKVIAHTFSPNLLGKKGLCDRHVSVRCRIAHCLVAMSLATFGYHRRHVLELLKELHQMIDDPFDEVFDAVTDFKAALFFDEIVHSLKDLLQCIFNGISIELGSSEDALNERSQLGTVRRGATQHLADEVGDTGVFIQLAEDPRDDVAEWVVHYVTIAVAAAAVAGLVAGGELTNQGQRE